MTAANHQIVRDFFVALPTGSFPEGMLTDDMKAWTLTGGEVEKPMFVGGMQLLSTLFPQGLTYCIDSLTAEEDRVAAQVHSYGTLINGERYENIQAFFFIIRDGRVARMSEYMIPSVIEQQIMPLMQAAMAGAQA